MVVRMVMLILIVTNFTSANFNELQRILVISFDGFRYDYYEKNVTPTLEKIKMEGTAADYMKSVFITKTFPNHHSLATGLYPESHGVMGSSFFDPESGKVIHYKDIWAYNNDSIVPIWTLNEQHGGCSGVSMWPGSEFFYQGIKPTYIEKYDPTSKWTNRVDKVIEWFLNPAKPANLVFMYFNQPDADSHLFGPDSPEVLQQIKNVDNITDYILLRLRASNLTNKINMFFVSDHGMDSVTYGNIINVTTYLTGMDYKTASTSPVLHIIPNPDNEEKIYSTLKNASLSENFTVYKREELLDRWHYKNNIRSPPILLVANEGYAFDDLFSQLNKYEEITNRKVNNNTVIGCHGYDNLEPKMQAFFIASGPLIKENHKISPFEIIDLYPLFTHILKLPLPEINGSLVPVESMLKTPSSSNTVLITVIVVLALIGIITGSVFLYNRRSTRLSSNSANQNDKIYIDLR